MYMAETTGKPAGRPTVYTEEIALRVCDLIRQGVSVNQMCKQYDDLPDASTIHLWVFEDRQGFSQKYADAKTIGAEIEVDEMEEIARNEKDVQRAKLIIDTRKWSLSKRMPKKYGDRIQQDVSVEKLPTPLLDNLKDTSADV